MKILPKLTEDQFNELDENLQENYRRIDPKGDDEDVHYALEVEGLTDGLKSALKKERDNAKAANARVNELAAKLSDTEAKLQDLSDSGN